MTAVDAPVLIHAHHSSLPGHPRSLARLTALAEGDEPWGIPLACLAQFVRVITHPRFPTPFSPEEACDALARLFASESLHVLTPGPRFAGIWMDALKRGGARGNLVFAAEVYAVCREAGVRLLVTEDADFARFSDLPTERP